MFKFSIASPVIHGGDQNGLQKSCRIFMLVKMHFLFAMVAIFFVPKIVSQRCSPAPAEYLLSLKCLYLLDPQPQKYRVYGLQNLLPPSLFTSEGEGAPPPQLCLLREQFAAGDAVLQPFWGVKSSLDDDDFALTLLRGKKKIFSLSHRLFLFSLPLFFNPFIVSLTVFHRVLIGFIHAMQFC